MFQEQLVCILTRHDGSAVGLVEQQKAALTRMFTDVGCIHFAAFAVLPPLEGDTQLTLALELAVDPDVPHEELISRLIGIDFDLLWTIYEGCLPEATGVSDLVKRTALYERLLRDLRGADGGFVGARDRSVDQILAERELFKAARSWLQENPPAPDETRSQVAQRIAKWRGANPRFHWAAEATPRSFWRSSWMSEPVRAILVMMNLPLPGLPVTFPGVGLFAVLPVLLAAMAFAGVLALLPFLAVVDWQQLLDTPVVFGEYVRWSKWAVGFASVLTLLTIGIVIAQLGVPGLAGVFAITTGGVGK